jgi:hypothetical protein
MRSPNGILLDGAEGDGGCLGNRPGLLAMNRGDTLYCRRRQTWEGHRRRQNARF